MADTPRARPMSPHLTVWRWHITMATSILHRATGVALYGGGLIAAAWALSLAAGPETYGAVQSLLRSLLGRLVLFGLTASIFFHLATGVRHLVWDLGYGLELKSANASSITVFAFTLVATLVVWAIAALSGALG